jgi:predicted nucleotidyltransferase
METTMAPRCSAPINHVQPYLHASPNIPLSAIRRFARQIGARFRPDKIVLFGSYAYGTPHLESDVDMLVVMPASNEIGKSVRITLAFDPPFALDLIVRTPQHIARGLEEGDSFLRKVMEKGRVLYEAPHRRVGAQGGRRSRQRKAAGRTGPSAQRSSVLSLSARSRKVPQGIVARHRRRRALDT